LPKRKFTMEVEEGQVSARLDAMADETNDRRDHDELHAAADVAASGLRSEYIDRWINGLLRNRHA